MTCLSRWKLCRVSPSRATDPDRTTTTAWTAVVTASPAGLISSAQGPGGVFSHHHVIPDNSQRIAASIKRAQDIDST